MILSTDFDENWTMMILMMSRCPIRRREACSSSKHKDEFSNAYTHNQIPTDFDVYPRLSV